MPAAGAIEQFIRVGSALAMEAGRFLKSRLHTRFQINHKGAINLVTDVDVEAEEGIVSGLKRAFPDHSVLAEENHSASKRGPLTWIIDPLDGTTNFAHGFPFFCVSMGLEIEGVVEWGMVYNPNLEEIFTARRGAGATLNGRPIRVSATEFLGESMLATGFPYDIRTSDVNNLDNFRAFALRAQAIRRAGSAALDLCYLAAGRFDGFWELKLNPWDCAAGYLVVREAGGTVTNLRGDTGTIYDRECVASNSRIHGEMLEVLGLRG